MEAQSAGLRPGDPRILATALRAAIDAMHAPLAAGIDPGHCADELVALFDAHSSESVKRN